MEGIKFRIDYIQLISKPKYKQASYNSAYNNRFVNFYGNKNVINY